MRVHHCDYVCLNALPSPVAGEKRGAKLPAMSFLSRLREMFNDVVW